MAKLSEYTSNAEVKTYEIWEHLKAERKTHKTVNRILFIFCAGLTVSLVYVARKPPALIPVDSLGKAAYVSDYRHNNQKASKEEVTYVVKMFLSNYIGPVSEVIDYQLAQALNLLASSLQQELKKDIEKENVAEKVKKSQIKTELKFEKIRIENEVDEYVYVNVLGLREIYPLNSSSSEPEKDGFRSKLRLRQVPRTEETPNGLLIDYFRNEFVSVETVEAWKDKELPSTKKGGSND